MSVSEKVWREKNLHKCYEYQAQFFGFSARQFFNYAYNQMLSAWQQTVDEVILPSVVKSTDIKRNQKAFRTKMLNRLFQNGFLDLVIKDAQKFSIKFVFAIPENVTLPVDEPNLDVEYYDEDELLNEIELLNAEISQLKRQIKLKEVNKHNEVVLRSFFEDIERELAEVSI